MKNKNDTPDYAIKPPLEHETVTAYVRWKRAQRFGILVVWLMILAVIVMVVLPRASADEHPLCSYFEAVSHLPGVRVAEWIGYPDGWRDMPETWDYITITDLPGGTSILSQVTGYERWLWGFRSDQTWTDANGDWDGHHDFCEAVLIIYDNE
jgi:hypothetical protein